MSIDRRMLLRGAVACACCLKAGVAIASDAPAHGGAAAAHWSYEGDGNPEKWGELQSDFKMCQLGLEQTPIDLSNGIKGDVGSVDYDYKPLPLRIVNNGHTIQVNADPGSACVIGGDTLRTAAVSSASSERTSAGGKGLRSGMPLRAQVERRSARSDRRVHPARCGEPGPEDVLRADARQGGPEVKVAGAIDIAAILPKSGGYFRYMGSLTTPPCSEGLTWTVHKEPIEASVEQIQKFAALFPKQRPSGSEAQSPLRDRRLLIACFFLI